MTKLFLCLLCVLPMLKAQNGSPAGTNQVDPAMYRFLLASCNPDTKQFGTIDSGGRTVVGVINPKIDLGSDWVDGTDAVAASRDIRGTQVASKLVELAVKYGKDACPTPSVPPTKIGNIKVFLFVGDPDTFTQERFDWHKLAKRSFSGYYDDYNFLEAVDAAYPFTRHMSQALISSGCKRSHCSSVVEAENLLGFEDVIDGRGRHGVWRTFDNFELAWRQEQAAAKAAELARKQAQQQEEMARQAQAAKDQADNLARAKEISEGKARYAALVAKYGVKQFIGNLAPLVVNPFVFQGQTLAMTVDFSAMTTATQGLFSSGETKFLVSGLPTGLFTREGYAFLAVRVIGKTEYKTPVGPMQILHLSFVAGQPCQRRFVSNGNRFDPMAGDTYCAEFGPNADKH